MKIVKEKPPLNGQRVECLGKENIKFADVSTQAMAKGR